MSLQQPLNPSKTNTRVFTQLGEVLIRHGIEMPPGNIILRVYPFAELVPGASFDVAYKSGRAHRVREAAKQWAFRHKNGWRFRVLIVRGSTKNVIRCWRLGTPDPEPPTEVVEVEEPQGPVSY